MARNERIEVVVTVHEGLGPMNLREVLAGGKHGEYDVEWSRLVPMGLCAKIRKGNQTLGTAEVSERQLFEAISDLVIRGIEKPDGGKEDPDGIVKQADQPEGPIEG